MLLLSMLIMSIIAPFALAKQRKTYLTDFIISNRIEQSGFSNTDESSTFSYEATMGALDVLNHYNLYEIPGDWGAIIANVNITLFEPALSGKINTLLTSGDVIIYDLAYLLSALALINYTLSSTVIDSIQTYIDETIQGTGGFSPINTSTTPSLISTYYGVKIYSMIGKLSSLDKATHKAWVLNCRNSDGGYGGNATLVSTIINTYYAVLSVNILGSIDDLVNSALTTTYIDSFFVSDVNNVDNFGGYLPDASALNAIISSTFYCTKIISLIDNTLLHTQNTTNWIRNRQNFVDGGFVDNSDGNEQKSSSITISYYAFEILKIFDAELESLNENVWIVEFNIFILIILLSVIGIGTAILITVWRKRKL